MSQVWVMFLPLESELVKSLQLRIYGLSMEEEWIPEENWRAIIGRAMDDGRSKRNRCSLQKAMSW